MPKRLTSEEVARFRDDGAVFPIAAIAASEAAALAERLAAIKAARGGRISAFVNAKPHLLLPWLWSLVHDDRIVGAVEDLLGPDLYCLASSFIGKPPGGEAHITWHQDATYWGLSRPEAATAWIALTPSTPESGCVRVIRGTHRTALAHVDSKDPTNLLGGKEMLRDGVDADRAADVELKAGEMSLHHPLVVHGSQPNRSGRERLGFAVRYIPGDVWQEGGSATLVRGRDAGRMLLETAPRTAFDPDALARHPEVMRRFARIIQTKKAEHAAASHR